MTDTGLAANLDELAKRLVVETDLKVVFTVTGTEADDGSLKPILPAIDSLPAGILWFQQETIDAGNSERVLDNVDLLIWQRGDNGGYGYSTLLPFMDALRVLMRTGLTNNARSTRTLYQGASQIYPQTMDNGQPFLVLPVHLQILRIDNTDEYSDT